MYIKRFSPGDIADVASLEENLRSGWSIGSIRQEIDRPHGLQLVAYGACTDTAIGWCCGFWVGQEAELLRIAVAQPKRKKGVASQLLAQFEKECAEQGVASIFLEVAEKNMAARRLYAGFSYTAVGRRKEYYSQPPDDALVMNKTLSRENLICTFSVFSFKSKSQVQTSRELSKTLKNIHGGRR